MKKKIDHVHEYVAGKSDKDAICLCGSLKHINFKLADILADIIAEVIAKPEHTPTPWEVYDTSNTHKKGRVFITGDAVMLSELPKWGDGKDLANAEFIVRAVNSHEELLKFVKTRHLRTDGCPKACSTCALVAKAGGK